MTVSIIPRTGECGTAAPGLSLHVGPLPVAALAEAKALMAACFGAQAVGAGFDEDVAARDTPMLLLATLDGCCVGFKLGHAKGARLFHSWLGGVHPDWRRRGVGRALLQAQHRWCRGQGFRTITTVSKNEYRDMVILNLQEGFRIVGTEWGLRDGSLSIQFAKTLDGD